MQKSWNARCQESWFSLANRNFLFPGIVYAFLNLQCNFLGRKELSCPNLGIISGWDRLPGTWGEVSSWVRSGFGGGRRWINILKKVKHGGKNRVELKGLGKQGTWWGLWPMSLVRNHSLDVSFLWYWISLLFKTFYCLFTVSLPNPTPVICIWFLVYSWRQLQNISRHIFCFWEHSTFFSSGLLNPFIN